VSESYDVLRAEYAEYYGEWDAQLDGLLELDPDFLQAHLAMLAAPWRADVLDPKIKHLIGLAVSVSTTHLYRPGVRTHLKAALAEGATAAEVMEVFQLVTVIGMHSCNVGVPILLEELGEVGSQLMAASLTPEQEVVKKRYQQRRGNWGPHWEKLVRLSPAFLSAYTDYSMVPWLEGPLEPRVKELIYVAVNVSATHLYAQGLRVHVRNALERGATSAEVMAVYELATSLGMHSVAFGVPVLLEELQVASAGLDRP